MTGPCLRLPSDYRALPQPHGQVISLCASTLTAVHLDVATARPISTGSDFCTERPAICCPTTARDQSRVVYLQTPNVSKCSNIIMAVDTCHGASRTSIAPPPRVGPAPDMSVPRDLVSRIPDNQAPPTAGVTHGHDNTIPEEMTGHVELFCYCSHCEPNANQALLSPHAHATDRAITTALHTGWPLAAFPSTTDHFTSLCQGIYDAVRATGAPNFLQAQKTRQEYSTRSTNQASGWGN